MKEGMEMIKKKLLNFMLVCLIGMAGWLSRGAIVHADNGITVTISDIQVTGKDCTVGLYETSGLQKATVIISAGQTGSVSIGSLLEGVYSYTLKVTNPNSVTVQYDDTVYEIDVDVFQGVSGISYIYSVKRLEGQGTTAKTDTIKFTNRAQEPLTVTPSVEKVINGETREDSSFTFTLEASGTNNPPMPEGSADGKKDVTIDFAKGVRQGRAEFGPITFTEAGTFEYRVIEKAVTPAQRYFTYDPSVYTIKYVVSLEDGIPVVQEHILKANPDATDSTHMTHVQFVNDYIHPSDTPISETFTVSKKIEGTPDTKESFHFVLKPSDPDCPLPELPDAHVDNTKAEIIGEGETSFGEILFTEPGTYSYTITEEAGNSAGYTYDKSVYSITYVVTEYEEKGTGIWKLNVVRTVTKDGKPYEEEDSLVFTNTYTPPKPSSSSSNPIAFLRRMIPNTGDGFQPLLWIGLLICTGAVIFLVVNRLRNDRK